MPTVLKCWPEPFTAVLAGLKRYEVRDTTDRTFTVGEILHLREYKLFDPPTLPAGEYTGREQLVKVTYITPGGSFGLPSNLCVMSISPIGA